LWLLLASDQDALSFLPVVVASKAIGDATRRLPGEVHLCEDKAKGIDIAGGED
jgi:hypothetical protein